MPGWWAEDGLRPVPAQRTLQAYFAKHPVMAGTHKAAARLAEVLGPMFWAALIIGFVWAELAAL
jgi:hypothetical protein